MNTIEMKKINSNFKASPSIPYDNQRLRKERASPINTVATKLLKKDFYFLYKKFVKYTKENGLKTQKTLKNPCLIFKLIFCYLTMKQRSSPDEIISEIFQKVDSQLDEEIEQSYKDKRFQEEMKKKCHADIETISEAFRGGFEDLMVISEKIKPLYDKNIVDQPQHRRNRESLAEVLQRFILVKVKSDVGADYQISQLPPPIFMSTKQRDITTPIMENESEIRSSGLIQQLESDLRQSQLTLVEESLVQSQYELAEYLMDETTHQQSQAQEAPIIECAQNDQEDSLDMCGDDYEHMLDRQLLSSQFYFLEVEDV